MRSFRLSWPQQLAILCALTCLVTVTVSAADKSDATGLWKWSVERNGQTIEASLRLKQEGDKLTGALIGRNNRETEISDGKVNGSEISFKVVRKTQNGGEMITGYTAKIDGDTLKGKIERTRNGQASSTDWEAKRAKDKA